MLPGRNYRAAHLRRILLRRRWLILIPAAIGVAAASSVEAVVAGGGAGLLAGLVMTAMLEYGNSSFACEDDVVCALTLPVLGTVPVLASARERQVRRHRELAVDVVGVAVLLLAVVLVVWRLWA